MIIFPQMTNMINWQINDVNVGQFHFLFDATFVYLALNYRWIWHLWEMVVFGSKDSDPAIM